MQKKSQVDTSHYAECSTLMIKYKNTHVHRLIILAVLMLLNFYLQTYTFALNYTGRSIQEVMYLNDGKSVSFGGGLFAIGFTAIAFVVGLAVFRRSKSTKLKIVYVITGLAAMAAFTIFNTVRSAQDTRGAGVGVSHLAFGMGMLTIILSLACLALAFFAEQTRPKFLGALLGVLFLGMLAGCYNLLIWILMAGMYLLAIPEYRKMSWIVQQPGYPYFNERFDEAQEHSQYEPLHQLDHRSYAEMIDIDGNAADAAKFHREEELAHRALEEKLREGEMGYTMKVSDDPAEMPGIEEIFEKVEPLPEPEVPDADDIPAPVWNVPEPQSQPDKSAAPVSSGFPETSWDMPEANWDVPDINSDIPDLPDIPDIPQI